MWDNTDRSWVGRLTLSNGQIRGSFSTVMANDILLERSHTCTVIPATTNNRVSSTSPSFAASLHRRPNVSSHHSHHRSHNSHARFDRDPTILQFAPYRKWHYLELIFFFHDTLHSSSFSLVCGRDLHDTVVLFVIF